MIRMSQRMLAAASLVRTGAKVADIGCDHAYISIFLIKERIASSVLAMDVKKGPLEIAEKNIKEEGLEEQIKLRLSDGFSALTKGEVDTALICGMGGLLINHILEEGLPKMGDGFELVIGAQSELEEVRRFLLQHGFGIQDEKMVKEEGKFYTLMKAKMGSWDMGLSDMEYCFGPILIQKKDQTLKEYLEKKLATEEGIIRNLTGETDVVQKRKEELSSEAELIRKTLLLIQES